MLIGYTADEPQIRIFGQGGKVANLTLVTNERQRNNETGAFDDVAEWHRLVFWNRSADIVEQFVHKGTQIYAEGKIRTRSYTDKTGVKRYSTEIICDQVILLSSRRDSYNQEVSHESFVDGYNQTPSQIQPRHQHPQDINNDIGVSQIQMIKQQISETPWPQAPSSQPNKTSWSSASTSMPTQSNWNAQNSIESNDAAITGNQMNGGQKYPMNEVGGGDDDIPF